VAGVADRGTSSYDSELLVIVLFTVYPLLLLTRLHLPRRLNRIRLNCVQLQMLHRSLDLLCVVKQFIFVVAEEGSILPFCDLLELVVANL
jgi:hypothetical protein